MKLTNLQKNILSIFLVMFVAIVFNFVLDTLVFASVPLGLMVSIPLINLTNEGTDCNMAGISTKVYVILKSDVEEGGYPSLLQNSQNPEDLLNLIGNFVLKAGKTWTELYSTQEMGELIGEVDGARDGKYIKISGSIFYPKTTAKALGMMTILMRSDVYIIVKEFSGGGQMRVIGTPDLPAHIYGSENSGKAFADEKGITGTFEASNCTYAYVYNGEIKTSATLHGTYTVNNTIGLSGDDVTGYAAVTGWDKIIYPTLWFDIYTNITEGLQVRAYETLLDRDSQINSIFYADADVIGINTIIATNGSSYSGSLEIEAVILDTDDFDVTWTETV